MEGRHESLRQRMLAKRREPVHALGAVMDRVQTPHPRDGVGEAVEPGP